MLVADQNVARSKNFKTFLKDHFNPRSLITLREKKAHSFQWMPIYAQDLLVHGTPRWPFLALYENPYTTYTQTRIKFP